MAAFIEMSTAVLGLIFFIFSTIPDQTLGQDDFHEELYIKPFQSGHVYTHFKFTTLSNVSLHVNEQSLSHYNLFPKSLGQVISKYSVQELHLSLTQGVWRQEKWGYPITSAPPGAQLWVWFQPNTKSIDASWAGLVNALSGLFCASLNFVDESNTITPNLSFRPDGATQGTYSKSNKFLRYATLPREIVCTENLTPWKKLLPCDSKAGLSTLFHAGHLYNANYHSLSVDLRPICSDYPECTSSVLELTQSMGVVFEPPVHNRGRQDWTLASLFDRPLLGTCPLASVSKVYVDLSVNSTSNPIRLTPVPTEVLDVSRGDVNVPTAVFDLKKDETSTHIVMKWDSKVQYGPVNPPPLHTHRYLTGYGQETGGITSQIHNNDPVNAIRILYLETVPWFVRLYLHTLQVTNNVKATDLLEKKLFTPGKDRGNPYSMELVLTLPPNSVTSISIQFDKAYLKWTEHPPDANIGFHIGSAVVSAMLPTSANYTSPAQHQSLLTQSMTEDQASTGYFLRLFTEPLLIQLPTPDFSMPYNVICLACTVVAIGFGSFHNLTTRRLVVSENDKKKGGLLGRILGKFKRTKSKDDSEKKDKDSKKERVEEVLEDSKKDSNLSKKDR